MSKEMIGDFGLNVKIYYDEEGDSVTFLMHLYSKGSIEENPFEIEKTKSISYKEVAENSDCAKDIMLSLVNEVFEEAGIDKELALQTILS